MQTDNTTSIAQPNATQANGASSNCASRQPRLQLDATHSEVFRKAESQLVFDADGKPIGTYTPLTAKQKHFYENPQLYFSLEEANRTVDPNARGYSTAEVLRLIQ